MKHIPEGTGESVRQFVFTLSHVRRVITIFAACLVVGIVGVAMSVSVLPRRLSYESLLDENLALKSRLREIESKLDTVDEEIRRVRYFSAQLEGLPEEARPGAGPLELDEVEFTAWMDEQTRAWLGVEVGESAGQWVLDDAIPMDPELDQPLQEIADVRKWADRLEWRIENSLAVLKLAQGLLGSRAESHEYLRTRLVSMPTAYPLKGVLTSPYGQRRHPLTGQWKMHRGLDISAPIGSEIYAPASGTVIAAGWNAGYGIQVAIDHGYGVVTRFAHLRHSKVRKGQEVKKGQPIGPVGMTGSTMGPICTTKSNWTEVS